MGGGTNEAEAEAEAAETETAEVAAAEVDTGAETFAAAVVFDRGAGVRKAKSEAR